MKQILIFLLSLNLIKSGCICSEDELIRELREDLADNYCLRNIKAPPVENATQQELRLAAQWDSDCAFEAQGIDGKSTWIKRFYEIHGVTNLIDVDGKKLADNSEDNIDQADMCEIVRTLIGNGKFRYVDSDVNKISLDALWIINCVGSDTQTKICAFNQESFMNNERWHIIMDPPVLTFDNEPKLQQQIFDNK